MSTSLEKYTLVAFCDALEKAGFKRIAREYVNYPFDKNFSCWVGINTSTQNGIVHIEPFVGIHVADIEKMWTDMTPYAVKYDKRVATYARHMGELVPNAQAFRIEKQADVERESARFVNLYETIGIKYAASIANYKALEGKLRERIEDLGGFPERYACCLLLNRKIDVAENFVKKFAAKEPEYFGVFAERFLKLLEDETGDAV